MPKFLNPFEKPAYLEQALFLYTKYSKFLDDDYARNGMSIYDYFVNLIKHTSPFFYVSNIIGDNNHLHCAELTTCFDKRYWGSYTKMCAIIFLNFCFEVCGFEKIKVLVYPDNVRTKALMNYMGFKKEGLLKGETLRNNKLQDIEVYACRKAEK